MTHQKEKGSDGGLHRCWPTSLSFPVLVSMYTLVVHLQDRAGTVGTEMAKGMRSS